MLRFFVIFVVMDYIEFFTENNANGLKTKEKYISESFPDIYGKIVSHCDSDWFKVLSFKEKIWYFMNGVTDRVTCYHCGADVKFKGTLNKGYGKFCSLSCANDSGMLIKLQKDSIVNKYGVDSTNQLESVKAKKKLSCIKNYGVDNPMKSDAIKKKFADTMISTHGVDNPMKSEAVRGKVIETCLTRYGHVNPFQSEEIKNKIKSTNNKNLGVDYPTQSESVKSKLKEIGIIKLKERHPYILSVDGNILKCECERCGSVYEISRVLLNERHREGYLLCTECNPIGSNSVSDAEKRLVDHIRGLGVDVVENDTELLSGMELDIYIPSHNLAVEYNGLYWHSELYKSNDYHLNKTKLCEDKGVRLIHIFEDEWIFKQDIVKSRINNILGVNDVKIYARKCEIREVSVAEARLFLDTNHIQGFAKSKVKLGLYFNDELVSLMTFGHGRVLMGGKVDEWELVRFANRLNTSVVGGASRLLKHFIKTYQPKNIISYADKRWSQGELYKVLGFDHIHDSKPNYWYIINNTREYRFKYRKSELIKNGCSSELSERQIMSDNKRYRIYDCGNMRFQMALYN
jgi:hypothetical protein